MIQLLEPVALCVRTTELLMLLVLSDMNDDTARLRTRDGKGPSIAWQVGHLLEYRCQLLRLFGVEKQPPFAIDFTATGATDGLDYPTIEELRAAWEQLQAALADALK